MNFYKELILKRNMKKRSKTIRLMKDSDLKKVCHIYIDANKFTTEKNIIKWTSLSLKEYPNYHFILEKGGKIIAAASVTLRKKDSAMLEDIAVRRDLRGKGHGTKLLNHIIKVLKRDKVKKLRLWVHWASARAVGFYYKNKFKLVGLAKTKNIQYVPNNEDILILEKILSK